MISTNAVRRPRSSQRKGAFLRFSIGGCNWSTGRNALLNRHFAKKAERDNPAAGRFHDINGVRLHYVERGSGDPLILLHGNGSMIEDFECTGPIDLAAKNDRVIAFDRPGFGHSDRPRSVV